MGNEVGEVGRGLWGTWTCSQSAGKLEVEGLAVERVRCSVPACVAPFGALCHMVSTSEGPSTQNRSFPWRSTIKAGARGALSWGSSLRSYRQLLACQHNEEHQLEKRLTIHSTQGIFLKCPVGCKRCLCVL